MKKMILFLMAVTFAVVLAACGSDEKSADKQKEEDSGEKTEQATGNQEKQDVKVTEEEKVAKDKVVAKVNGSEIKGSTYNTSYAQTKMMASQYGQDVSDKKKLKEQTLNSLIQQELVIQEAKEKGIEVSKKEVQSEFEKTKSQGKERFTSILDQLGLTEAKFKEQLEIELTLQKYMDKEVGDVKVTDKEIKDYYDKVKKQQKDIPKLEEVKGQIKKQLKQQKEQQKLQSKVQELQEQADVKQLI